MTGTSMTIPTLETARLVLRAPSYGDFAPYSEILMSPRAIYMDGPFSQREAWQLFGMDIASWLTQGFGYWTFADKKSGAVIGFTGLSRPPNYKENEFGWFLLEGFEGQGFAFEATTAARDWARETLNLPSLVSYMDSKNTRSEALALRLGAVRDDAAPLHEGATAENCRVYRHWPEGGL